MNTTYTYDMKAIISCALDKVDALRSKNGIIVREEIDESHNIGTVTLLNGEATLDDLKWYLDILNESIVGADYRIKQFIIKSELFTYHVDYDVLGVKMENGIGLPKKKFKIQ